MRAKFIFTAFFLIFAFGSISLEAKVEPTAAEIEQIGSEAYIYAYPLVTMDMTKKVMTNVAHPEETKAPLGQFANFRRYPDASFRDVTTPNADTLYSSAWLDLAKEPWVLHVPNEYGRYYLMPVMDGWTNIAESIGTRTTGTEAKNFVITGPNWKGNLPKGLEEVKSPTNMVWILGRTYCTGTPQDYKLVHTLQDQYSLTPLSSYGRAFIPQKGVVDSTVDMQTAVRDQVEALSAAAFFTRFVELLKENPPVAADQPLLEEIAKIGIVPGRPFELSKFDPKKLEALEKSKMTALEKIRGHDTDAGKTINGWLFTKDTGKFGTNYLQRAFVAMKGLGANLAEDAVYPSASVDSLGQVLKGTNQYTLHFEKGDKIPVEGFWSLTMYDKDLFFVANPLNRYTLSQRNQFKYNPDGSLDFYIQQKSPGKDKEANWLPAPEGNFFLIFRLYWPEKEILDGAWKLPSVVKK